MRPSQQIQPNDLSAINIPAPVLYRCFDAVGELLYVGFTNDPHARFKQHRSKSWWNTVDHITLHGYRSFKNLEQDEARAIRHERPKYNKAGRNATIPCADRSRRVSNANIFETTRREGL